MQEIFVPEALIILFLLLALIRPLAPKLRPLGGLAFLPLLAFICALGLTPAYGFRPEALPLIVFSGLAMALHLPGLITAFRRKNYDEAPEPLPALIFPALILLGLCGAAAFYFAPAADTALTVEGVETLTLDGGERGGDYFLRLYRPGRRGEAPAPLLILIPPAEGSIRAVDLLCGNLRQRGFSVLTWSRRGFDSPAAGGEGQSYGVSGAERFRRFRLFWRGRRSLKANALGRAMEEERREELLFILSWLEERPLEGSSREAVFLAGWNEGGSALALLACSRDFVRSHPRIRGIVLVESPLWSFYQEKSRVPGALPPGAGLPKRLAWGIKNWFLNLGPGKIEGLREISGPLYPVLALASARALEEGRRRESYEPLFRLLEQAGAPSLLAVVEGAGPLDYSDYPVKYPLLSFLSSARGRPLWRPGDYSQGLASLIANFAAILLENPSPLSIPPAVTPPEMLPLPGAVRTWFWDWNLPNPGDILSSRAPPEGGL